METRNVKSRAEGQQADAERMLLEKAQEQREQRLREQEARLEKELAEFEKAKGSVVSADTVAKLVGEMAAMREQLSKLLVREDTPAPSTSYTQPRTQAPPTPPRSEVLLRLSETNSNHPDDIHEQSQQTAFSIREAVEFVPTFDGKNIPVLNYIRECQLAKDLIPPNLECSLTRHLVNRLKGRASLALKGRSCTSITHLCEILRNSFSPHRTIGQYRAELSGVLQGPNEDILEYENRVNDLRAIILDMERINQAGPPLHTRAEIDTLALQSFCDGLLPDIRDRMRPEDKHSLTAAYDRAREIYRQQQIDKERYQQTPRHTRNDKRNAHSTQESKKCDTCGKTGHVTSNCWHNPENKATNPSPKSETHTPGSQNLSSSNDKFCRYCKKPGHEIHECRKRQYNNKSREQGNGRSSSTQSGTSQEEPATRPVRSIQVTTPEEKPSASLASQ